MESLRIFQHTPGKDTFPDPNHQAFMIRNYPWGPRAKWWQLKYFCDFHPKKLGKMKPFWRSAYFWDGWWKTTNQRGMLGFSWREWLEMTDLNDDHTGLAIFESKMKVESRILADDFCWKMVGGSCQNLPETYPIGSMGLEYLPTFTIDLSQM